MRPATAVYTHEGCLAHFVPGHPEMPERMTAALDGLDDLKLPFLFPNVQPADRELLALAHSPDHVNGIQALAERGGGWIDADTFVVPASFEAAALAAGAATQALHDVVAGSCHNAIVIARPPGHHATAERAMGFCLFNSAAVAVRAAMRGQGIRRAAIIDIDVHHGNGTQDIFWRDPDVLYCSTHQFPFYPGSGGLAEMGGGPGEGTTLNVPLMAGCGDRTYLAATDEVLVPALRRFAPECILVSLGFDAHWADPLAGMNLSLEGYAGIMQKLLLAADELCDGRLVVLLEGGYDLDVVRQGMRTVGSLLAGQRPLPDLLGQRTLQAEPSAAGQLLEAVAIAHNLP